MQPTPGTQATAAAGGGEWSWLGRCGLLVGLLVASVGCGPTAPPGGARDGGAADAQVDARCQTSSDCESWQTCDLAGRVCVAKTCAGHSDCGAQAFCNDSGSCEFNHTGGPCEQDLSCPAEHTCISGICGCEGESFAAQPSSANIMIVLDRSLSMDMDEDGDYSTSPDHDPTTRRWDVAIAAIDSMLSLYGAKARFGVTVFASDVEAFDECEVDGPDVDIVSDDTTTDADNILSFLASKQPESLTPIGAALRAMRDLPSLADTTWPNYVLLIADGGETCQGDGPAEATALFQQTPPVKTFAVGFSEGITDNNAETLNQIATNGGTARPGDTKYYQADDADQLNDALGSILGSLLACTYQLAKVPDDPSQLYVFADKELVVRDPTATSGWDYDPATNSIRFYGAACSQLRAGTVEDLDVVYGCPLPPVD